jgi:hypothetical protein
LIEIVSRSGLKPLRVYGIRSHEFQRLAGLRIHPKVVGPGDVDVAAVVGEDGRLLVGIHIDAEVGRCGNRGASAGCLHVERLALPQSAGANVKGALRSAKGNRLGSEVDKSHIGIRTNSDVGLADFNFCPPIGVSVDAVTGCNRIIAISLAPLLGAHRLNGHGAVDNRQAPGLRRIVVLRKSGGRKNGQANSRGDGQRFLCDLCQ